LYFLLRSASASKIRVVRAAALTLSGFWLILLQARISFRVRQIGLFLCVHVAHVLGIFFTGISFAIAIDLTPIPVSLETKSDQMFDECAALLPAANVVDLFQQLLIHR
jgi:hypothetical protein